MSKSGPRDLEGAELTERQRKVLDFIRSSIEKHGYPPTIREIGNYMGIRSTNGVNDHLKALTRKGYLAREELKSRAIVPKDMMVKGKIRRGDAMVDVPVLGKVAAGAPILAEENISDTVRVDSFFLGPNKKVFALRVAGNSMIEDGIFDGDYVFVKKQPQAEPGEIVVAMIEGEATVKRFYPERDRVRFQPANSAMKPIYVSRDQFRDTQILGTVVGIYRRV
ncbi:MAG: LexA repressor [Myxococcota bacterium]|nr:LexA repressor [Myxococcota bacterium]